MADSSSKPALVLIHGFCEDKTLWDHLISDIKYDGQILAIDLPGFGESPLQTQSFSLNEIAEQVYAELTEQGVSSCICIGHSLGGYVTFAFKKSYPDFVKKIGLVHSTAYEDSAEKKEVRNKLVAFLDENPASRFLATFAHTLFCDTNKQKLRIEIDKVVHMSDGLAGSTIQAYAKAMRDRENNIETLISEEAPLFIAGECDNSVPKEMSEKQIGLIKDSRNCYMLENVAHMGMYEAPKTVLSAIEQFINE